jgi:phage shock protein A
MMLTRKHNKHIQDAEDREEMIKQELWDFMDDYKVVTQNRAN